MPQDATNRANGVRTKLGKPGSWEGFLASKARTGRKPGRGPILESERNWLQKNRDKLDKVPRNRDINVKGYLVRGG